MSFVNIALVICLVATPALGWVGGSFFSNIFGAGRFEDFGNRGARYIAKRFCANQGSLSDRFQNNLQVNDANGDGFVVAAEIMEDFTNNYDINQDGCASRAEVVLGWATFYNFTVDFTQFFIDNNLANRENNPDETCLVRIADLQNAPINIPADTFTSDTVQTLVDFCESSDPSIYTTNCDCVQLNGMCFSDPRFQNLQACIDLRNSFLSEFNQ